MSSTDSSQIADRTGNDPIGRRWRIHLIPALMVAGLAVGCGDDGSATEPAGSGTSTAPDTDGDNGADRDDDATGTTDGSDTATDSGEAGDSEDGDGGSSDNGSDDRRADGLRLAEEQVAVGSGAPVAGFAGAEWTMTVEIVDTTSYTDSGDQPCAVVAGTLTLEALPDGRDRSSAGDVPVRLLLDRDNQELRIDPFCQPEDLVGAGHQSLTDLQAGIGEEVSFYDAYDLADRAPARYVVGDDQSNEWVAFTVG
jgi:hypothetical protein